MQLTLPDTIGIFQLTSIDTLSIVFLLAGSGKIRKRMDFKAVLEGMPFPIPTSVLSILIPSLELMIGITLGLQYRLHLFSFAATAMLVAFTAFTLIVILSGKNLPCPCFGNASRPIDRGILARNLILLSLSFFATFRADASHAWSEPVLVAETWLAAIFLIVAYAVASHLIQFRLNEVN